MTKQVVVSNRRTALAAGRSALLRNCRALGAVGVLIMSLTAMTAVHATTQAQARYQAQRAACLNGTQDLNRANCLREAAAALQDSRAGRAASVSGQAYERNRLLRCDALPQSDREDCLRRMQGEGTLSGTVENGGIYRELVTPVIPSPNN